MTRNLSSKWLLLLVLIGLISCHKGFVYSQFKEVGSIGLGKGDWLVFNVEVPDSSLGYDVNIIVRYSSLYPYSDIHLLVKEHIPGISTDSFKEVKSQISGSDKSVNAPRWSSIGVTVIPYQKGKTFPHGKGMIQIKQNMKDSSLPGIMDIGIEIVQK